MNRLVLEKPSLKRKVEAIDLLNEFVKYNSDTNGFGKLNELLEGKTYEEWLEELEKKKIPEYVEKLNICLSNTYFVIRCNDNKIVGMVNVRYKIPQAYLDTWASHIGYSIRPTERNKGYAKEALYLALQEEKRLGEKDIIMCCYVDNIASNKVILSQGGEFIEQKKYVIDNELTNYYKIDLSKIEK